MSTQDAMNAVLQGSLDAGWKTPVPMTNGIAMVTERFTYDNKFVEDNAKVGKKGAGKMIKTGGAALGSISILLTPDEAGLMLAWALGYENPVTDVVSSIGGKHHEFVGVPYGNTRLPSMTFICYRVSEIQRYISNQVVDWTLNVTPNGLITMDITTRGYTELENTTPEYPTVIYDSLLLPSTLDYYKTCKGVLQIDLGDFGKIDSFTITGNNNLTDRGQGLAGDCGPRENMAGSRVYTVNFAAEFDATAATMREAKYKKGDSIALALELQTGEEYEAGYLYKMGFDLPQLILTQFDANVPDSGEITVTGVGQSYEATGSEALYAWVEDLRATTYLP